MIATIYSYNPITLLVVWCLLGLVGAYFFSREDEYHNHEWTWSLHNIFWFLMKVIGGPITVLLAI